MDNPNTRFTLRDRCFTCAGDQLCFSVKSSGVSNVFDHRINLSIVEGNRGVLNGSFSGTSFKVPVPLW